jgi:large subunit ribosomal protein L6
MGKRPVTIAKGVTVTISDHQIEMKGPQGSLIQKMPEADRVEFQKTDGEITVTRKDDGPDARRQQGLVRALLMNQMTGVSEGYKQELDIVGIGYKAEVKGKELHVSVGYASPKVFPIPEGLKIKVEGGNRIFLESADKWLIGQSAATIRKIRPPEPYKGKGIRYFNEQIKRKVGKAAVGTGG